MSFLKVYGAPTVGLGVVALLILQQASHEEGRFSLLSIFHRRSGSRRSRQKFKGSIRRIGSGDFRYVVEDDGDQSYGQLMDRLGVTPQSGTPKRPLTSPLPPRAGNRFSTRAIKSLGLEEPLVICMVGLPARGKSYLVKMIERYLKWSGYECEVFNVGNLRRGQGFAAVDAAFFDPSNQNGKQIREKMAMEVQDNMYAWLHEKTQDSSSSSRIAIFDATNTTKKRRLNLANRAQQEHAGILFVESICDDQEVLQRNYRMKLKNDDYKNMYPAAALKDFADRVSAYERIYEEVGDEEQSEQVSYIKIINVGQKIITRNCSGFLSSEISFYLMNVHIHPKRIFLSLVVDEESDSAVPVEAPPLTVHSGDFHAEWLGRFFETLEKMQPDCKNMLCLTGSAQSHLESVLHLRPNLQVVSTQLLNELRGGDFQGLSLQEIQKLFPGEFAKREQNRLSYRNPGVGGESYLDVLERVKPVVIELERQRRSVLVVGHVAVLRCIYAYFLGVPLKEMPHIQIKRDTLLEITTSPFGSTVKTINPSET
jgi:predicted kinase